MCFAVIVSDWRGRVMDPAVLRGHAWLPEPGFGAPPATSTTPEPAKAPLFPALTCGKLVHSELGKAKSPFASSPHCCLSVVAGKEGQQLFALQESWSALLVGQE